MPSNVADSLLLADTQHWLQCAETHSQCIEGQVALQEPVQREFELIVHDAIANVVASWQQSRGLVVGPVGLKRFGSRQYMCALPGSDFDLVCEMPPQMVSHMVDASWIHDSRAIVKAHQLFLQSLLHEIVRNRSCELVKDAIDGKITFVIRYRQLSIDVTATASPADDTHSPYRLTACINSALDELPPNARRLAQLITDVVKHNRACVNGGRVSQYLKGVHWVLLVIAWWRLRVKPVDGYHKALGTLLHDVCQYYAELAFETTTISATSATPFMARSNSTMQSPIVLLDPIRTSRNLSTHIDSHGVSHIRDTLSRCCQRFLSSPNEFWQRQWKTQQVLVGHFENLPKVVALWHERDGEWTPTLCVLCNEKTDALYQVASNLCSNVLSSCLGRFDSLREEDVLDEKITTTIASLGAGFNTHVRQIVVQGGELNGLTTFGAGDAVMKRSRASKLSLAAFIRATMPSARLHDPTGDGAFERVVHVASVLLEGMQGQVATKASITVDIAASLEQHRIRESFEQEQASAKDFRKVDFAITQEGSMQDSGSVVRFVWNRYAAPHSGRIWFWNHNTEECFFADESGPWSVYTAPNGRRWWWHARGDWFYEDLANTWDT